MQQIMNAKHFVKLRSGVSKHMYSRSVVLSPELGGQTCPVKSGLFLNSEHYLHFSCTTV